MGRPVSGETRYFHWHNYGENTETALTALRAHFPSSDLLLVTLDTQSLLISHQQMTSRGSRMGKMAGKTIHFRLIPCRGSIDRMHGSGVPLPVRGKIKVCEFVEGIGRNHHAPAVQRNRLLALSNPHRIHAMASETQIVDRRVQFLREFGSVCVVAEDAGFGYGLMNIF